MTPPFRIIQVPSFGAVDIGCQVASRSGSFVISRTRISSFATVLGPSIILLYFSNHSLATGKLAGVIADYASISPNIVDVNEMEGIYHQAFGFYFMACLVITLASLALVRVIKKLIS